MTMLALLLLGAVPDPVTAEAAVKTQRSEMRVLTGMDCPPSQEGEEIVVCGRRGGADGAGGSARFRVPYQPEPGRRIRGEGSADGGGCMRLCHQPLTIDPTKIPGAVKKVIDYFSRDD